MDIQHNKISVAVPRTRKDFEIIQAGFIHAEYQIDTKNCAMELLLILVAFQYYLGQFKIIFCLAFFLFKCLFLQQQNFDWIQRYLEMETGLFVSQHDLMVKELDQEKETEVRSCLRHGSQMESLQGVSLSHKGEKTFKRTAQKTA